MRAAALFTSQTNMPVLGGGGGGTVAIRASAPSCGRWRGRERASTCPPRRLKCQLIVRVQRRKNRNEAADDV